MKKNTRTWCLISLFLLGSAGASQAQQTSGATEKAVVALENQWLEAQKTNNSEAAAALWADKIADTESDGTTMTKAQMLADAKARKYASVELENLKVAVYGDTAIATGGLKSKGTDPSGKPFESHVLWTDTWVKMPNGKWQCVATQSTPIKA
jgi:ketosteroid isomerase-like protein